MTVGLCTSQFDISLNSQTNFQLNLTFCELNNGNDDN